MTDEEKQAKKEYQRNYYKKLESYQNEQLLEKAKRGEKSGQLLPEKERNKCKSMSKIKY